MNPQTMQKRTKLFSGFKLRVLEPEAPKEEPKRKQIIKPEPLFSPRDRDKDWFRQTPYGARIPGPEFDRFWAREWNSGRPCWQVLRPRVKDHLLGNPRAFHVLKEVLTHPNPDRLFWVLTGPYGLGKTSGIRVLSPRRTLTIQGREGSEYEQLEIPSWTGNMELTQGKDQARMVDYFSCLLVAARDGNYDLCFDQCETYFASHEEKGLKGPGRAFFGAFLEALETRGPCLAKVKVLFCFSGDVYGSSSGCRVLLDHGKAREIRFKPSDNKDQVCWTETYLKPYLWYSGRKQEAQDPKTCSDLSVRLLSGPRETRNLASLGTELDDLCLGAKAKTGNRDLCSSGTNLYDNLKKDLYCPRPLEDLERTYDSVQGKETLFRALTQVAYPCLSDLKRLNDLTQAFSDSDFWPENKDWTVAKARTVMKGTHWTFGEGWPQAKPEPSEPMDWQGPRAFSALK